MVKPLSAPGLMLIIERTDFMRLPLIPSESDCLQPIYDDYIKKEDTLDYVIPDVKGDVGKILDVRGQLLVVSRKASAEKVIVCLSVRAEVIYETDGGGEIQCVSAVIPADMTVPVSGSTGETLLYTQLSLCSVDVRMLNPRKLNLRCEVGMTLRCWNRETRTIYTGAEPETPVCILQRNENLYEAACVGEKSFTVTDSYLIPEEMPQNAELLSSSTTVCVGEVKSVGNKLIFKSQAETDCIFMCRETGRLFNTVFSSAFSQLLELESVNECLGAYVCVQVCEANLREEENGSYSAELSLSAHGVCSIERDICYIADAYSNRCELSCESKKYAATHFHGARIASLTLRGRLPICAELTELCYFSAAASCVYVENDSISAEVLISGVGRDEDGDLCAPQLRLCDGCTTETSENETVLITSVCIGPALVTSGFEICVEVTVEYALLHKGSFTAMTALELKEDCPCRRGEKPSITVLCSDNGEDIWSIAKRCGSTIALIESVNTVDGHFSPGKRPLLVPKG